MPIPSWAAELVRRSVTEVASKTNPETIDRLRAQATSILNDIPAAAARTVDSVMGATETTRHEVRSWAKSHTAKSREVINATGTLVDPLGRFAGLAPGSAIDADVLAAGMEFFDHSRMAGPGLTHWMQSVVDDLSVGVEMDEPLAMLIVQNLFAGVAIVPTLSPLPLVLHRGQATTLPGGMNVPDIIGSLGFAFEEFGSIQSPSAVEYEGRSPMSTVFVGRPPATRMLGDGTASGANARSFRTDVLPLSLVRGHDDSIATISASLQNGADAVVTTAGGLLGGPDSGIVVGRKSAIDRLRSHRLFHLFVANDATIAMSLAALSRDPAKVAGSALSRLHTAIENLQSRADRITTRLLGHESSPQIEVRQQPATLMRGMGEIPSRQVAVRIDGQTATSVAERLRSRDPTVLSTIEEEWVLIDLRWMRPEQDADVRL